ncbi:hypothetical protein E2C01_061116 [Portunus trituberculatus]|uniref:Uncharacterized protein n=1 Tax=Portunus trituberculatus TaxID=210409 RepID=A0A5B7HCC6_PORTR|nr:hypothetical protein [Portunus trituberculatus]
MPACPKTPVRVSSYYQQRQTSDPSTLSLGLKATVKRAEATLTDQSLPSSARYSGPCGGAAVGRCRPGVTTAQQTGGIP